MECFETGRGDQGRWGGSPRTSGSAGITPERAFDLLRQPRKTILEVLFFVLKLLSLIADSNSSCGAWTRLSASHQVEPSLLSVSKTGPVGLPASIPFFVFVSGWTLRHRRLRPLRRGLCIGGNGGRRRGQQHRGAAPGRRPRGRQSHRVHPVQPHRSLHRPGHHRHRLLPAAAL